MDKTCSLCKKKLPITDFNKKGVLVDGSIRYQSCCKECNKITSREYYKNNKSEVLPQILARNKTRYKRISTNLIMLKKELGCCNCPEGEPVCLDFHHVTGEKNFEISYGIHYFGLKRIEEEILKCVLICSNCHRKLHAGLLQIEESKTVPQESVNKFMELDIQVRPEKTAGDVAWKQKRQRDQDKRTKRKAKIDEQNSNRTSSR